MYKPTMLRLILIRIILLPIFLLISPMHCFIYWLFGGLIKEFYIQYKKYFWDGQLL